MLSLLLISLPTQAYSVSVSRTQPHCHSTPFPYANDFRDVASKDFYTVVATSQWLNHDRVDPEHLNLLEIFNHKVDELLYYGFRQPKQGKDEREWLKFLMDVWVPEPVSSPSPRYGGKLSELHILMEDHIGVFDEPHFQTLTSSKGEQSWTAFRTRIQNTGQFTNDFKIKIFVLTCGVKDGLIDSLEPYSSASALVKDLSGLGLSVELETAETSSVQWQKKPQGGFQLTNAQYSEENFPNSDEATRTRAVGIESKVFNFLGLSREKLEQHGIIVPLNGAPAGRGGQTLRIPRCPSTNNKVRHGFLSRSISGY